MQKTPHVIGRGVLLSIFLNLSAPCLTRAHELAPPYPSLPLRVEVTELEDRIARLEARLEERSTEQVEQPEQPQPSPCPPANTPTVCPFSKCVGYDSGFYVKTCDDQFSIKIQGLLQFRYDAAWRDIDSDLGDDDEAGFVLARAPLVFSGNLFGPQLKYWSIVQGNPSTGSDFVEEAKIIYERENGLLFQAGRFRDPAFLREMDVSYTRQLGVERSYFNSVFTTGVLEGVSISRQHDVLRWITVVSDGRNSGASSQHKDFFEDAADIAITAAVDWKLFGEWAQYGDFPSWPDEEAALFLGAAIYVERGERGDDVEEHNRNDFLSWTFDVTFENAGWMTFAAVVGRHSLARAEITDQYGALLMASYQLIPDRWEPFARYEYIDFDGVTNVGAAGLPVADSSLNLLGVGANWYFHRHSLKLTVEAVHAWDPVPFSAANTGLLADQTGRDGQTVLRSQLQLFF